MADRKAGFAHVWDVGAWVSASPRVRRVVAASVGLLLAAGLTGMVANRPGTLSEPLTMAAAVGPVDAVVAAPGPAADVRPLAKQVSRSQPKPRPHETPKPKPVAPAKDWSYWSKRIRGCESHGRPDAPPNYNAKNPDSSASGAYQILDATWGGRYGVDHASDATPEQQEAVAADLYRRRGTADWASSAACWR